jgi:hypothetical protein
LEIQNYFTHIVHEKGLTINIKIEAEKFESFYSSKNWFVGKNKMTDWKKAISGWVMRQYPTNDQPAQQNFKPPMILIQ